MPSPSRFLAAVGSSALMTVLGLPQASWAVISALFVTQINVGATFNSVIYRLASAVLAYAGARHHRRALVAGFAALLILPVPAPPEKSADREFTPSTTEHVADPWNPSRLCARWMRFHLGLRAGVLIGHGQQPEGKGRFQCAVGQQFVAGEARPEHRLPECVIVQEHHVHRPGPEPSPFQSVFRIDDLHMVVPRVAADSIERFVDFTGFPFDSRQEYPAAFDHETRHPGPPVVPGGDQTQPLNVSVG
ncbi:FUSC family protein [Azospirillum sp. B2RO_4]